MSATTTYPKSSRCRREPPAGVVAAGGVVDAISMPAAFAALVRAELDILMLAGPVLIDRDEGSWTFLTLPAGTPHATVPTDLLPLGVRTVPAGTPVGALAAADRPELAPAIWSVVIGVARRVAHRTRRVA